MCLSACLHAGPLAGVPPPFDAYTQIRQVGAGLFDELNFLTEASHIARFAETYETPLRQLGVVVPTVDRKLSSTRVLVTEWIDGTPPRDLPPVERQALARTAVRCLAMQLMTAGFIHCDPHEGNLLALKVR